MNYRKRSGGFMGIDFQSRKSARMPEKQNSKRIGKPQLTLSPAGVIFKYRSRGENLL